MGAEKKKARVVFITTKNLDYIRNVQEVEWLERQYEEVLCIGSTSRNYVKRLLYVYWTMLSTSFRKYDAIFIGFAPQLVLPFWKWKFRKKRVVIDFFISVYDTMVCDRGKISAGGLLAGIIHKLDEVTLRWADIVIGDTKAHVNFFSEEFHIPKDKFKVLYLEADKSIYYPHVMEKYEEWKDSFLVLYFGSILPLQGVPVVIETVNHLKGKKDIVFWIIGPIGKLAEKICNSNVRLDPWLSQEELSDAIAMADLCLAGHFNANIDKADRTIPGKAYIYEQMQKNMILGDTMANHEMFVEDDRHFFVERGNSVRLAEKIVEVKSKNNP